MNEQTGNIISDKTAFDTVDGLITAFDVVGGFISSKGTSDC